MEQQAVANLISDVIFFVLFVGTFVGLELLNHHLASRGISLFEILVKIFGVIMASFVIFLVVYLALH